MRKISRWRRCWPKLVDTDGASTVVDGPLFVRVHFLRKRKSSLLLGVGEDPAIVAGRIANA